MTDLDPVKRRELPLAADGRLVHEHLCLGAIATNIEVAILKAEDSMLPEDQAIPVEPCQVDEEAAIGLIALGVSTTAGLRVVGSPDEDLPAKGIAIELEKKDMRALRIDEHGQPLVQSDTTPSARRAHLVCTEA